MVSSHVFAQSKAIASASATIVYPVGIETESEVSTSQLSLTSKVGANLIVERKGTTNVDVASFTVIGDGLVYNVSTPVSKISVRKIKSNESLPACCFTINRHQNNSVTGKSNSFTIKASILVDATNQPGHYTSKNDFELIINFN
jgi:hypothetical protein